MSLTKDQIRHCRFVSAVTLCCTVYIGTVYHISRFSGYNTITAERFLWLFRPPYGDYNNMVVGVTRDGGYYTIQWDVDVYATTWKPEI